MPTCRLSARWITPANDRGTPAGALREGNWRHSLIRFSKLLGPAPGVIVIPAIRHAPRRFAPSAAPSQLLHSHGAFPFFRLSRLSKLSFKRGPAAPRTRAPQTLCFSLFLLRFL